MVEEPQPGEPDDRDPDRRDDDRSDNARSGNDADRPPFEFDPSQFDLSGIDLSELGLPFDLANLDFSKLDLSNLDLANLDLANLDLASLGISGADVERAFAMMRASGPVNWQVARQMALWVASAQEAPSGPLERGPLELTGVPPAEPDVAAADVEDFEELAHAAQTLVVGETGLAATFRVGVQAVNRAGWVEIHLDELRPVLVALATTLGAAMQASDEPNLAHPSFGDAEPSLDPAALIGALAPMLLGVQSGSMIGYLAQRALGGYDWPLPTGRSGGDPGSGGQPRLCFVVPNVDEFERAWSLPRRDLRFYVALHEVVRAAQRSVPWVRDRLVRLATEYVSAYEVEAETFAEEFGDVDPTDPSSLQAMADHPERLLGALQSPRQRVLRDELRRFTAVTEGYADVVLERVGRRLIPTFDRIHEAMQRHRVERGEAERFIEGLLGFKLDRGDYERGTLFCRGVIERAELDGLNRLWESESMLPTPAELEAPGLWLARIELPTPI